MTASVLPQKRITQPKASKEVPQIQLTEDLGIFKKMTGNRKTDNSHVNKLIRSIQSEDMLVNPIIVNEKMEVIDGQHRLEAARQLKSHIFYMKLDGYDIEDVRKLNSTQKNWSLLDYIKCYAEMGKPNYQEILDFIKKFDFLTASTAYTLMSSQKGHEIRSGLLKNTKKKRAYEVAEHCKAAMRFGKRFGQKSYVISVASLYEKEGFSMNELLAKIEKYPKMIRNCATSADYVEEIEVLYNKNRRNKVNLRF